MKKFFLTSIRLASSATARSTYLLFAGNLLDSVFAFGFTVLTFQLLSNSDFGIFSALNNLIFTGVLVLDFGLGAGLLHFLPRFLSFKPSPAAGYFSTAVFYRLAIALATALVISLLSPWISPRLFSTSSPWPVIMSSLSIVVISVLDILVVALQASQKFFRSVIGTISFSFLRLLFIAVFFLFHLKLSLLWAVVITLASPILGIFLSFHWIRLPFSFPNSKTARSLFGFSGPMGIYKIASTITARLDVQMVLLLLGPATTGIYSVASRLANFYLVIAASLTAVLASKFSHATGVSIKSQISTSLIAQAVLAGAMLIGVLIARPFVTTLFGSAAAGSVVYFQGLTLAYIPLLLATLPLAVLAYYFKIPRVVAFTGFCQLLITLAGNIIFLPVMGAMGSVLSLGFANLFVCLYTALAVYHQFSHPNPARVK